MQPSSYVVYFNKEKVPAVTHEAINGAMLKLSKSMKYFSWWKVEWSQDERGMPTHQRVECKLALALYIFLYLGNNESP